MNRIDITTTPSDKVIATAIKHLAAGEIVIFPTETTYGAGVDATNPEAVKKLLAYKSRREGKPLSIAVTDEHMAAKYTQLNDQAKKIMKRLLPGPVTVVVADNGNVAPGVASEFNTLGLRIPDYPLITELVAAYGKPITATSANGSNQKRPYSVQDILDNLSAKQSELIGLILDAGQLPPNPPSTVIDTTLETPLTMRSGSIRIDNGNTYPTHSAQETQDLAGKLLLKHWNATQRSGLVITLDGPLGAGKTEFTKGIASFLQISDTVTSPTYSYLEEYAFFRHQTAGQLHHLDVWKIDSAEMLSKLNIPSLFGPSRVVVIEWWQQIADFAAQANVTLPKPWLKISLEDTGESTREITVAEYL